MPENDPKVSWLVPRALSARPWRPCSCTREPSAWRSWSWERANCLPVTMSRCCSRLASISSWPCMDVCTPVRQRTYRSQPIWLVWPVKLVISCSLTSTGWQDWFGCASGFLSSRNLPRHLQSWTKVLGTAWKYDKCSLIALFSTLWRVAFAQSDVPPPPWSMLLRKSALSARWFNFDRGRGGGGNRKGKVFREKVHVSQHFWYWNLILITLGKG